MKGKEKLSRLKEDDGPFTYVYLAVTAIPGMKYPDNIGETVPVHSFTERNAEAFLTPNWDMYCAHMDRSNAIAILLLTAFHGQRRFAWLSQYWDFLVFKFLGIEVGFVRNLKRETARIRKQRHKEQKSPGCYLVYRAEGALVEPPDLSVARRAGNIGFGIDNIRRDPYRKIHKPALHATVTALSMAIANSNGSPHTDFIGDVIYLKGKEDLTFYCRIMEMGSLSATISSKSAIDHLESAKEYIPAMLDDNSIETAISLFVQPQNKGNGNLRSFIAAWSALELIVNRLSKTTGPKWCELLSTGSIPVWDKDLKNVLPPNYRLRDRFFAVACVLNQSTAVADADVFVRANDKRSDFYHRMGVKEEALPTNDVQMLFRKYLRLSLSYQPNLLTTSRN